jgi:hypothetical protein
MELREENKGKKTSRDFVSVSACTAYAYTCMHMRAPACYTANVTNAFPLAHYVQDLLLVFETSRKSYQNGWPEAEGLGVLLSTWDARRSVGYSDLLGTGFQNESQAILSFLNHYKRYDFLKPDPVDFVGATRFFNAVTEAMRQVKVRKKDHVEKYLARQVEDEPREHINAASHVSAEQTTSQDLSKQPPPQYDTYQAESMVVGRFDLPGAANDLDVGHNTGMSDEVDDLLKEMEGEDRDSYVVNVNGK